MDLPGGSEVDNATRETNRNKAEANLWRMIGGIFVEASNAVLVQ